ncbi:hypothetical protein E2320_022424 [Naja naja]|nr:hypothetical protein E2320_022424 [Naja naja]
MEPRVSWMEKVGKEDPNYWVRNTQMARDTEEASRGDLETLRLRYNQSKSLHTWQRMYGCELRADGSRGGFDQYGYDGRTFLTFDKETLTWVAPDPQAQITKRKWDTSPVYNRRGKAYLEEICIKWLEKHLSYGKETLLKRGSGGAQSQFWDAVCCQRPTMASGRSMTRDGEILQDTFHGSVAPNADGTYYWLSRMREGPLWCREGQAQLFFWLEDCGRVSAMIPTRTFSKERLLNICLGCVQM